MEKRKRARAIIIVNNNSIISMYREFDDRKFYTFPGGGTEGDETMEECVVREVGEEYGITVKPLKKLYEYDGTNSIEYFYLCEWISGEFGSGKGEEYDKNNTNGVYKPTIIKIADIPNLPLMPAEVATSLYTDFVNNKLV